MTRQHILAAISVAATLTISALTACAQNTAGPATSASPNQQPSWPPKFQDVTVHDPMVIQSDGTFYVFGSHLAVAKTRDLMTWTMVGAGVRDDNPVIPNVTKEMKEALDWSQTRTFWAGSVIRLADGRFYYYYTTCKGDSPRAAIGLAVADRVQGPYKNTGILFRSGMWDQPSADGRVYDATIHPNATDTHLFRDKDGQPWMVYGSYSGGIFVLKIDEKTGHPLPGQGYGKKLLGENHSRIEAPSILYNQTTGYYYLFLSFGGLGSTGGYQIRAARSHTPDGPFLDPQGHDMINCHGPRGSFFDNAAIEPYGAKLIGNFQFLPTPAPVENRPPTIPATGYVSPGHNSVCYDAQRDKCFIFFHTRFPGCGEWHQVRVHQILFNTEGWPVMTPHRYAGESLSGCSSEQVAGEYQFLNHGRRITPEITHAQAIRLTPDGKVTGPTAGSWKLTGDHTITLTLDGVDYYGVLLRQWDPGRNIPVLTFTALSNQGVSIWGNSVAAVALQP